MTPLFRKFRSFVFTSILLIGSMQSFAGIEPYQTQLKGTIKKGDTLVVKDEKFRNAVFDWNEITNRTVRNYISLQLTYDTPVVLNKAFTYELDLKVEYYSQPDQAEPVSINSVKLKINFSPDTGATYKAKDVYSFSNGYWVKITVNNITCAELGANVPPVLQLTNQVVIDRKYAFHPEKKFQLSGTFSGTSTAANGDGISAMRFTDESYITSYFLHLSWLSISGAEEYDIEWAVFEGTEDQTTLNQALANQTLDDQVLNELFRNNATRITTSAQVYDVSMIYSQKYIMVRMRQAHYTTEGIRVEGPWDYKRLDENNAEVFAIWEIQGWHQPNLNWQYSGAFTEDGKKKEIVSYFDGTLRSRQTVTINNSEQVAVVMETVYDEFGRQSANILPAPTDDNRFRFYPNFNRPVNSNGQVTAYDYRNLNGVADPNCENLPAPLDKLSGAARYYSDNNPFTALANYNKYIPNADGYPLYVTQYVNDNSNSIRTKGSVGSIFQPGSAERRVTKYYYGKPETWELDRLFGNDVGYAHHYLKNMVVDPNGQISISYQNASGKTIAAALTGGTPQGMDDLANRPAPQIQTITVLRPDQFIFDASALELKGKTTYLASILGAQGTFNYDIQQLVHSYQGTNFQVCSNCFYDLTIQVMNDCGDVKFNATNPVQIGTKTADCGRTAVMPGNFDVTFDQIGEYYITFSLKLSNRIIDAYTETYIKQRQLNGDMLTHIGFILNYLREIDFTGCFSECTTCEAALGTPAQFRQAILGAVQEKLMGQYPAPTTELDGRIDTLYTILRDHCLAQKANCMASPCSRYEKLLLDDVSPGGQYALFTFSPGFTVLEPELNVISQNWMGAFPDLAPGHPDYEAEAIYDENNNKTSPYDANFTLEMMVKYWKDEWAVRFLPFHPEKCKLDFCNTYSNYMQWDTKVTQFVNKASDIPNIPGNAGSTYSYSNGAWMVAIDPFFANGGAGASYRTSMEADLNEYSTRFMGVPSQGALKGLTQVIDYLLYCSDLDGNTNLGITVGDSWNNCVPVTNCRVPDREWDMYKDFYFQVKEKYYQLLRNNTTCADDCAVGTPYDIPTGSCATRRDFGVEKVIEVTPSCAANQQRIKLAYLKGAATRPMTVELYFPAGYPTSGIQTTFQFAIGESEKTVCVPDYFMAPAIKVKSVICTGSPAPPAPCNGTAGQLSLGANGKQIASNQFTDIATGSTDITTYTIVKGRADQPPADATYCADGTVTTKQFYNCYKVFFHNSNTPIQYYNVWVIGCARSLCANSASYFAESQINANTFFINGSYYYVWDQTNGTPPSCSGITTEHTCVKFFVGSNPTPITFINVNVTICNACSVGQQSITAVSSPASNVYATADGGIYHVFPNTTNNYNPTTPYCSTPEKDWFPCFHVTLNGSTTTFYNATVLYCPPSGGCAEYATYYVTGVREEGGYQALNDPKYYILIPYQNPSPPEWQICDNPVDSRHEFPPGGWCLRFRLPDETIWLEFSEVILYTCEPPHTMMAAAAPASKSRTEQTIKHPKDTRLLKDYRNNVWYLIKRADTNDKNAWKNAKGTDSLMKRPAAVQDFTPYRYSRFLTIMTAKNQYHDMRDVWVAMYKEPAKKKTANQVSVGASAKQQGTNAKTATANFQTLQAGCPEALTYKNPRFPEFNIPNGATQYLQDLQNENNALVAGQLALSCEMQADKWMQQLQECLVLYPGQATNLRNKLIEVCMKGGDLDHPFGASTTRPGETPALSFKQVIQTELNLSSFTMICNPWLLDEPHPYEPKQQAAEKTIATTNADLCTRLQQLRTAHTNESPGTTFYQYLVNRFGSAMTLTSAQTEQLLKGCDNCRYLLASDLTLPVFLEPGTTGCITAADYSAAKTALNAEFGGNLDPNNEKYGTILANYMNHRYGFAMSYFRYQDYETLLQQNPTAALCNKPPYAEIAVDQYTCLKELVASAVVNGLRDYDLYIAEEKRKFRNEYVSLCSNVQASTRLTTQQHIYQYTLYYYDQAGNLVRTVPPEGVRPLNDDEIAEVNEIRKFEAAECSTAGLTITDNKSVALTNFSNSLQSTSAQSVELWLYNNSGSTSRQVRFVTPDNKYFYQAAIHDKKLWVELYTLEPAGNGEISITASNHIAADVSNIALKEWSQIVVQAAAFASGTWTVYMDGRKLTALPEGTAPPYPFEWEIAGGFTVPAEEIAQLKHMRLYKRPATDAEVLENYRNNCLIPAASLRPVSTSFIMWARFNYPSLCNGPVETRTVNNRGSLQITGDLGFTTNVFNNITNNFTVEMWVNPVVTHQWEPQTTTGFGGTAGQRYAIYPIHGGVASTGRAGMGISVGTNGVSVYEHADSYMPALLSWQGSMTGWHHIAVVYRNRQPFLYVDGQQVATGLVSPKLLVSPSYNFGSSVYGVMLGSIDEVRIWDYSRTGGQIAADYNRSLVPGTTSGLVAYWPMNAEDGSNIRDITCAPTNLVLSTGYTWSTTSSPVQDLIAYEIAERGIYPRHRLRTNYVYNSYDEGYQTQTPESGTSYLWYDRLGKLIATQHAEQRTPRDGLHPNRYSYIKYDQLGRTVEKGERRNGLTLPEPGFLDNATIANFHNSGDDVQITETVFDKTPLPGNGVPGGLLQEYLQNRISAGLYRDVEGGPVVRATYYSYDLIGNVKTLWQQVPNLSLKRLDYEYDLASGKTNFVRYQHGQPDQFYYAYKYDAENRVIESWTGTDAIVPAAGNSFLLNGQMDASFRYYLHGPVARIELGHSKVQGLDYAYTLQGWLKALNGNKLNPSTEIGGDGHTGNTTVARDAIAFTLGYFTNDYSAIGGAVGAPAINMPYTPQSGDALGRNLYNGNISNTTVAIRLAQFRNSEPTGYTYRYDQLNRLKEMRYHPLTAGTTTWSGNSMAPDDAYRESITYDGNGNIKTLLRNGTNAGNMPLGMDNLTYRYNLLNDPVLGKDYLANNKLRSVADAITDDDAYSFAKNKTVDLDNQTDIDNYAYDNIGNLVQDLKENVQKIEWNADGRIQKVIKTDNSTIEFQYDAAGYRVGKIVNENGQLTITNYVNDAQGNTIAVYSNRHNNQVGTWWKEQHLYATERLGMWRPEVNLAANQVPTWNVLGQKSYEIINQLGSVVAVITDKKIALGDGTYEPEILTAYDYYSFGMLMPGKVYGLDNGYRYGYNGKEQDNDVKGQGSQLDFGLRIYDARLARFLSVDPRAHAFPWWTPYQYAGNSPITYIDLDGAEPSKWLRKINVKLEPTTAGFIDGLYDGSGAGMFESAWKFVFDSDYRNEIINAVATAAMDPASFVKMVYEDYKQKVENIIAFNEEGRYELGHMGGEIIGQMLLGGGINKFLGYAKKFPAWKKAMDLANRTPVLKKLSKSPCGCLPEDTKVLTKNGLKPIAELKDGDFVLSYNDTLKVYEYKPVYKAYNLVSDTLFFISIKGEILKATHDHPFLTKRGWITANGILAGDSLLTTSGKYVAVITVERKLDVRNVYNFEVRDFHTYVIGKNRVVVHNSVGPPCDVVRHGSGFYRITRKDGKYYIGKGKFKRADTNLRRKTRDVNKQEMGGEVEWWEAPDEKTAYIYEHLMLEKMKKGAADDDFLNKIESPGKKYLEDIRKTDPELAKKIEEQFEETLGGTPKTKQRVPPAGGMQQ